MTYQQLKEKLILLDKNTRSWSGDALLKNFQMLQDSSGSKDNGGPAPMEVDNVYYSSGKGKGKKGKGKGKKSWNAWGFMGSGYGKNGKSKGKGKKGKSKGKHKGKNKGKSSNKGGQGNRDRDICRLCHQPGHWGNECPLYSANQVTSTGGGNGSQQDSTSTTVPSSQGSSRQTSSSTTASVSCGSSSRTSTIRQVKMYHVATPPSEMPEIFELNSEEEEWWPSSSVRAVVFSMADGEEDYEMLEKDELYDWYITDGGHRGLQDSDGEA